MIGSLGFQELALIMVVALLIFGPRELPKIGRTIGRTMAEFRRASNDLKRTLNAELIEEELRETDPRQILRETAADLEKSVRDAGADVRSPKAAAEAPVARSAPSGAQPRSQTSPPADSAPGGEGAATGDGAGTTPAARAEAADE